MINYLEQARTILWRYRPLEVDLAIEILKRLGHDDEQVMYNKKLLQIRQICGNYAPTCLASKIEIEFYGGPVGRGKWFKGTLDSLVHDAVAVKIQMEGIKTVLRLLRHD